MRGNLPTWMYEHLTKLSNEKKLTDAEHEALLSLVETAREQGFDEGWEWGADSQADELSEKHWEIEDLKQKLRDLADKLDAAANIAQNEV